MSLNTSLLAVIARGICIPVFIWIGFTFFSKYRKSNNKYFAGYFIFFIAISIVQIAAFVLDLMTYINPSSSLSLFKTARFHDYTSQDSSFYLYADNFVRPSYLLIFIMFSIGLGSMILPLEIFSNYKRKYLSTSVYITALLVALIYIPPIRNSYYCVIVLTITIIVLVIGIFFNIIQSLLLAVRTVGEVRKRSIMVLVGFFLYVLGMLWSARAGWSHFIYAGFNLDSDVIIGSAISIFAVILYYLAFRETKF